jgi:hypothetical protein
MISERSLSGGDTFHVFTLPKGTVLFHGFNMNYDGRPNSDKIISELFGDIHDDMYCVAPTTQRFFYPAPYVADVVMKYQIHAIYIANYDINLLMKVLPSNDLHQSLGGLDKPSIRCTQLGDHDSCESKYHSSDHCLTPVLLREHPDIHGYISIPNNDGSCYKSKFFTFLKDYYPTFVSTTTPMIVSDAKGLEAIPEIVVHPYHHRSPINKLMHPSAVYESYRDFIKNNSALLNLVPLVYFSESHIYSVLDMTLKNVMKLASAPRSEDVITPLQRNIHTFLNNALSPCGVKVNEVIVNMTIDLRTGFYIAKYNKQLKLECEQTAIKIYDDNVSNYNIVPFHYPSYMKKRLHGLLASTYKNVSTESHLSRNLSKVKACFNKKYVFDKGKSKTKFELEKAFPRPDLYYNKPQTRKHKNVANYKSRKTYKAKRDFQPFVSNVTI